MNNLIKLFVGNSVSVLFFTPFLFLLLNVLTLTPLQAIPVDKGSPATGEPFNDLPPGSAPVIAKAMLKDLPEEYQLRENDKTFSMSNPAHDMDISFTPDGLQVTSEGKRWGMVMTGIGTVGSVKPVQKTMPVNDDGMVVYARGDVSEWYINSPWGVEQGFTIGSAPGGKNSGNLVIELSLSGDLQLRLDSDTLGLADAQGNTIVRYTGLQVFDVAGKSLPAHLTLAGSTLSILVDDTHAKYPVTIDPWIQQLPKLIPSDGAAGDDFGFSVAVSGDTIVVGARFDSDNGDFSGSAYVFIMPGGGWVDMPETAKLTASDGAASDHFGWSAAISGDTIVVGALDDDDNGDRSGSAYVFVRPLTGWVDTTETAKLTASDGAASDRFGISVSVSVDTIVVGASYDDARGSAYVFVRPVTGWVDTTETAKLTASDGAESDVFGWDVAVSGDTIVVGAYGDDDNGSESGSAYVFVRPLTGWVDMIQTAKFTASDGEIGYRFGWSVAISGDTIVVLGGGTYVFVRPGSGWVDINETAKLSPGGQAVAFSGDTIVVGVPGDDGKGSAYVFVRPVTGWVDMIQTATLTASDGAQGDAFGWAVAISGDTIVVGGPDNDDPLLGPSAGSAYVYKLDTDNDGVIDANDNCPTMSNPDQIDSDADGAGDPCDVDKDNDGVPDSEDAFPLDPTEWLDTDNDGIGNNADTDDDNDGVPDSEDAFPLDPTEWLDTDNDGIGNNADTDDDNDGVPDSEDAFPLDPTEWLDTDNDGIGNNADTDDDNDGVPDSEDAFPLDPTEWLDTDNDGIGNNADTDDDNDGVIDTNDNCPAISNPDQADTDRDGIGDVCDNMINDRFPWPMFLPTIMNNAHP